MSDADAYELRDLSPTQLAWIDAWNRMWREYNRVARQRAADAEAEWLSDLEWDRAIARWNRKHRRAA